MKTRIVITQCITTTKWFGLVRGHGTDHIAPIINVFGRLASTSKGLNVFVDIDSFQK